MNVAFDAWIPVVTDNGNRELVSLLDVFSQGNRLADLAVRPHERVSLMRLFLCIAHASTGGPVDYDDWCRLPDRLAENAESYLTKWKSSFELFHPEKPWLQVADLRKTAQGDDGDISAWTPVSKLNFTFATGNNTTLFDHQGTNGEERKISLAETLLSMLTFQCFSTGGLISQAYWQSAQTSKTSKDAPCVSASMVHAFLRGENILETIHLNLPTHEDIRMSYGSRDLGVPVWEKLPASPSDKLSIENAIATYIGRLVPMARFIRLHPHGNRMLLGDGLVYPTFAEGFPQEPSATVILKKVDKKEDRILLSYRPSKALWRELSAVIVKRNATGNGGPLSLRSIQDGDDIDLLVAALARNQATIVDTVESVFHIPSRLRRPAGASSYETEIKHAEFISSRIGWAVEEYRRSIDGGWEGKLKSAGPSKGALKARLFSTATAHYWTAVEKNLHYLWSHIAAIDTDNAAPTREAWRKMLFAAACDAYRTACGQETPRQMRAFIEGWNRLTSKKAEEKSEELEEEA